MTSSLSTSRVLGGVLVVLLLLSGCRTYGKYNNEALMAEQIVEANRLFGLQLERARGDLATLEQGGTTDAAYRAGVEQFGQAVLMHEVKHQAHLDLAEELDVDDYRDVNRVYGAIITEQRIIRDRYDHILTSLAALSDTTGMERERLESFYQVVPQYYGRMLEANERSTVQEIARRGAMQPAPAMEEMNEVEGDDEDTMSPAAEPDAALEDTTDVEPTE